MARYEGGCHCGGVRVAFESAIAAADMEVRACQCSFCRMHQSLTVSDPDGAVHFTERTAGAMRRYRFGLATADFIICGQCGAYLGAVMGDGDTGGHAIVNTRVLDDRDAFDRPPRPAIYDDEDVSARVARRRARWTPLVGD